MFLHKYDCFIDESIESALVPFIITGKHYLKSPQSNVNTPPINLFELLKSFKDLSIVS